MPYFEKSLETSLSGNHVVSKTAKPPLVFLSSLFSHCEDTTGRELVEAISSTGMNHVHRDVPLFSF